jgi:hypothetical protein
MNGLVNLDMQGKTSKKIFKGMTKLFKKKSSSNLQSSSDGTEEDDNQELQTLRTIDQRSISESEGLSAEFNIFFEEAQRAIDFTRKTTSTKHAIFNPLVMGDKINQWRAKRKGNELHDSYTLLLSRAESVEAHLKSMTDHSLVDASTLLLQAVSLKMRLISCIDYNKSSISTHKPFIMALETLLHNFEVTRSDLMDMLGFLDEVTYLHDSTDVPFIPWALRNSDGRDITVIPFKREILEKRLHRVEKALDRVEKVYKGCRPVYEKFQKDLTHCQHCLAALDNLQSKIESHVSFMSDLEADREERDNPINAIIKKRLSSADTSRSDQDEQEAICGSATSEQPSNPNEPQISPRSPRSPRTSSQASKHISPEDLFAAAQEPFDHAHCSDCALTCLMANDCAMNLAAATSGPRRHGPFAKTD